MQNPVRKAMRCIARGLIGFTVLGLVLSGPSLVWLALGWPRNALPQIGAGQEDQRASPGMEAGLSAQLMALLRSGRAELGAPSLSAGVTGMNGVEWAGAVGWADTERALAATLDSRYRTGSVAKPITAVALMRLAQDQKIDLDAAAGDLVPELPPPLAAVTGRQLASHTAGVRHYASSPTWWPGWHEAASDRHYPSVASGLEMFFDDPLLFAPGTGFTYSTFGYSLLSRMMEAASGQSLPSLLHTQVFAPAQMLGSDVDGLEAMPARVGFYEGAHGRYARAHSTDSSYKIAGGGLVSTPSDLAHFGRALLQGQLLSSTQREMMWRPQPLASGSANPESYGLGWRIEYSSALMPDKSVVRVIHHGGSQAGASAFLLLLPEQGLTVAVMSNSGSARKQVEDTAYALARAMLAHAGSETVQD